MCTVATRLITYELYVCVVLICTYYIGDLQPSVPPTPHTTNEAFNEYSNYTLTTLLQADSGFFTTYWCFVGSNDHRVCCKCGEQCSEHDWVLEESKDPCSCKYNCSLTVNSVSMRYNDGTFYSQLFDGRNATLASTHITVISHDNSHGHKSHSVYYVIGSGAGVIVIIFLAIGIVCNIKERHCCSSRNSCSIHHPVDNPTSRKEATYYHINIL